MGRERLPGTAWTRAFVVLALFLLLGSSAIALFYWRPLLAAVIVVVVAAVLSKLRSSRGSDGTRSVWNAIPSWQYSGRHVESGGLTRDEQERALQDVQREADVRQGAVERNRRQ
ncbi:hypothetical protein HUG10_18290 [Halorarum halophilum]|uniref:Uncharacterized protein n=1 Tax=Halorarum halophilum TaxID=2743090 RepID=A0A7D5KKC7_9EURY|nr:hypothetical protein [Halobaculum halophilum]QLG26022.1 hypothetical protein HUG10_18290 [Halobaculum halophilum]